MRHHHIHRRIRHLHPVTRPDDPLRRSKHSLRFTAWCAVAICALVLALFLAGTVVAWLLAPMPIGPVLLGVTCFLALISVVVSASYQRYFRRYLRLARSPEYPCGVLTTNCGVWLCSASAEEVTACLREGRPLRETGEIVGYGKLCAGDLAALEGKTLIIKREVKEALADVLAGTTLTVLNQTVMLDQPVA